MAFFQKGVVSFNIMEKIMQRFINTPIGVLTLLADERSLIAVEFGRAEAVPTAYSAKAASVLDEAERQLSEYFAGERKAFDFDRLPIRLSGTEFTQKVGKAMLEIPFGEVRTYGEIAAAVGNPAAVRAVGGACHRNPLCIIVPCHRVVGAGRRLTGFGGGVDLKEKLLIHEGINGYR